MEHLVDGYQLSYLLSIGDSRVTAFRGCECGVLMDMTDVSPNRPFKSLLLLLSGLGRVAVRP